MYTYKSEHTGERVDSAVAKIPEGLPTEDSFIVVKANGSASEYIPRSQVSSDKLDKQTAQTTSDQVYGKLADGSQTMFDVTMGAEPTTIPRRDTAGRIQVADGVSGSDAVNFKQLSAVESSVVNSLDKGHIAYVNKENTFTEPQTFSYVQSDNPNWSEYGELGGSGANYSYTEYTDDTHKYSTSGEAFISSLVGRISVNRSTNDNSGTFKSSLELDVNKNWIARNEITRERIDGNLGTPVQTYYAYKFPKTYPNKEVTLATIEDLNAAITDLDKGHIAYVNKENTFTERQRIVTPYDSDINTQEEGFIDAGIINVSRIKYTDDTKQYYTDNDAILNARYLQLKQQIKNESGLTQHIIQLDHGGIKQVDYDNNSNTNYGYIFPKTYPNKNVTLATIEDLTTQLDTKLDKAGGTISGSLIIAENLTVQGKTTSVDTQNLKVADKLIYVAKDNTIALTSPAGLITPKYDGTNNGGIVYDNTGTAYVGDIVLDESGNVDVAKSHLQPIATRENAASFEDKHFPVWDKQNQRLADSGYTPDNFVDKLAASLRNQAYVRNANGEDSGLAYTYTDEGNTLALRNASGQLQVSNPSQDKDAANKSYADNLTARYVSTSILGG